MAKSLRRAGDAVRSRIEKTKALFSDRASENRNLSIYGQSRPATDHATNSQGQNTIRRGRSVEGVQQNQSYEEKRAHYQTEVTRRLQDIKQASSFPEKQHIHNGVFRLSEGATVTPAERPFERLVHLQGHSGFSDTSCVLVSCEQIINRFASKDRVQRILGHENVTEKHLLHYAVQEGLFSTREGLIPENTTKLLHDFGLSPQFSANLGETGTMSFRSKADLTMEVVPSSLSVQTLADSIKEGKSLLLFVNQDELYKNQPDIYSKKDINHAITVNNIVEKDNRLVGFIVNDSGIVSSSSGEFLTRQGALNVQEFQGREQFIPTANMEAAWLNAIAGTVDGSGPRGIPMVFNVYSGHIVIGDSNQSQK